MDEVTSSGDDLEMGGIAHGPAQVGKAEGAETGERRGGRGLAQGRVDLRTKTPLRLLGHGGHQGVAVRKVPERRTRRHRGPAGGLADRDLRSFGRKLQRSINQDAAEVAMVIGPGLASGAAGHAAWTVDGRA